MTRNFVYIALGTICIFYGLSIFMLRSGSRFFLVWFVMGAGFFALSAFARHGVWEKLPAPVRCIVLACVICVIAVVAAAEFLVLRGFRAKGEEGLDTIIVLGAQVWETGPSYSLKSRLDTAIEYLDDNPETVCIVSGGQGYNEPFSEARGMFEYLVSHGIDETRIVMEDRSANTVENILFSKELMKDPEAPVGIVTNQFHVFRAVAIAKKQGLIHAVGIAAPSHPYYLPNNMFREVFGIVKDLLCENM